MRELLSLCHRHNIDHVKVVGYNNGVVHFGHRHPGKTIVSTIRCRRMVHAGPHTLKADCGATVRNALDFLARNDQELYVVPNYSYVCLGTVLLRADSWVGGRLLHGGGHDLQGRPLRPGQRSNHLRRDETTQPSVSMSTISNHESWCCGCTFSRSRSRAISSIVRRSKTRPPATSSAPSAMRAPRMSRSVKSQAASREGHGRPVLQGSRRYVVARPRTPSRRARQAMGSPGGKPGHLLSHARPEPTRGLAYGAVFHADGVRGFLANARPGSPCGRSSSDICGAMGCPIHLAATRTASRPTCSSFAGTGLVFWNISKIRSRRSEPTLVNTAIKSNVPTNG